MTANQCVRCGRPTPDGYACIDETRRAADQLRQIADMTPAARDIAHGLSSRTTDGSTTGTPGSQIPIDLGTMAKLDAVQAKLTQWVDRIGSQRGTIRPWFTNHSDAITTAAHWLAPHLEWTRHQPDREPDAHGNTWGAAQLLTDVDACARIVAGIARGPGSKAFLGPCLAPAGVPEADCPANCECHNGPYYPCSEPGGCGSAGCGRPAKECEGNVYGYRGGEVGTCSACGARVKQAERRAWLDDQVRDRAFRAAHIADAYRINVKTIRGWATEVRADNGTVIREAKLKSYYQAGEHVVPWTTPAEGEDVRARGPRLYYVGDVLDLARQAADRRERRAAQRQDADSEHAESEGAA